MKLSSLTSEMVETFNDIEIDCESDAHDSTPPDRKLDANLIDREKIAELAMLSTVEYDRAREVEAECMGVRVSTLDKAVAKARKPNQPRSNQGSTVSLPEPE